MLKLQTGGERSLGDLKLLRSWILGRKPVLQLVTRLRQRTRERAVRVADHPAEQLGGDADRAELRRCTGGPAQALGRARGECAADR
jgi:hypothetical protein